MTIGTDVARSMWVIFYYSPLFFLNLHGVDVDLVFGVLSNKFIIFFIFHYYIIILILLLSFSGYIYIYFDVFLWSPILSVSLAALPKLFCGGVLETFVILLAILLPIKSPLAAVFSLNFSFLEIVLSASVATFLAWSRSFWLYLPF